MSDVHDPSPRPFDDISKRHTPALLAIARGIVTRDDLAWDAVQETLLCLWQRSTAPPDVGGWLVRTVVHKSMHLSRATFRWRGHQERAREERGEACPLCDPAVLAQDQESARNVEAAIASLSEELRRVLLLRAHDGLDYASIARLLAVPIGTVRSRLNRARESLAVRLHGDGRSLDE